MKEKKTELPSNLITDSLLLSENELLIYKDEEGNNHVITTAPYNPEKNYTIIQMSWEDFPEEN